MKFLLIGGKRAHKLVTQYILEEAKLHFDTATFVPLNKVRVVYDGKHTRLMHKNTDLGSYDACYARLFPEDFLFGETMLDILSRENVYTPTNPEAFRIVNHKYYTIKYLAKTGVLTPATSLSIFPKTALRLTEQIGFPAVVKLVSGFGGRGVMLANGPAEFGPLTDTLELFKEAICTQEYIKNPGRDVRAYVFGDVVETVYRYGAEGDWRSNVSRGGRAEEFEAPKEYTEAAVKVARALGLDFCAVDMLESEKGPMVVEVNFTPGILWKFFGDKLAKMLVQFIYKRTLETKTG